MKSSDGRGEGVKKIRKAIEEGKVENPDGEEGRIESIAKTITQSSQKEGDSGNLNDLKDELDGVRAELEGEGGASEKIEKNIRKTLAHKDEKTISLKVKKSRVDSLKKLIQEDERYLASLGMQEDDLNHRYDDEFLKLTDLNIKQEDLNQMRVKVKKALDLTDSFIKKAKKVVQEEPKKIKSGVKEIEDNREKIAKKIALIKKMDVNLQSLKRRQLALLDQLKDSDIKVTRSGEEMEQVGHVLSLYKEYERLKKSVDDYTEKLEAEKLKLMDADKRLDKTQDKADLISQILDETKDKDEKKLSERYRTYLKLEGIYPKLSEAGEKYTQHIESMVDSAKRYHDLQDELSDVKSDISKAVDKKTALVKNRKKVMEGVEFLEKLIVKARKDAGVVEGKVEVKLPKSLEEKYKIFDRGVDLLQKKQQSLEKQLGQKDEIKRRQNEKKNEIMDEFEKTEVDFRKKLEVKKIELNSKMDQELKKREKIAKRMRELLEKINEKKERKKTVKDQKITNWVKDKKHMVLLYPLKETLDWLTDYKTYLKALREESAARHKTYVKERQDANAKIKKVEDKLAKAQSDYVRVHSEIHELHKRDQHIKELVKDIEGEVADIQEQLPQHEVQEREFVGQLSEVKTSMDNLNYEKKLCEANIKDLKRSLARIQKEFFDVEKRMEKNKKTVIETEKNIEKDKLDIEAFEIKLINLLDDKMSLKARSKELEERQEILESEIKIIESIYEG